MELKQPQWGEALSATVLLPRGRLWNGASLLAQSVQNTPATRETSVRPLGWEDPLEEGIATHYSILGWRIPMDRGAWQATQSMGSQRVGHDSAAQALEEAAPQQTWEAVLGL